MGQVYRATDTKLKRQVAIKILPPSVAADHERLARFQREAQVLASLNHPNIAQIYGLEESTGVTALVMELVEGEDLSQRIARGAIPLDDALLIARQIAEALEAAHEQGIIHRDLKPANIKVRDDGTVKVLDFGLAKAPALEPASAVADATNSPTITSPAMTQIGMILGTAAYMSPEQARGKPIDRRTDIWAFACVFYEMLTGHRAFYGDDVAETIGAVIHKTPNLSVLPAATPPSARKVLARCFEKDRARRRQSAGDLCLALDEAQRELDAPPAAGASTVRQHGRVFVAALAVAALAGAVTAAWLTVAYGPAPSVAETRLDVTTPPTDDLTSFAISPDGRQIVFVATSNGQPMLWVRPLASTVAELLAGTEGAAGPFWSPDSRQVAFFANSELKRIELGAGLRPQTIARPAVPRGGAWNEVGVVLFLQAADGGVSRVAVSVGGVEPATTTGASGGHRHPQFLPDGRRFVFAESGEIRLASLDDRRVSAITRGGRAWVVRPGWLVFTREDALFAQRFDVEREVLTGDLVRLADGIAFDPSLATSAVSVSESGVIGIRTGDAATTQFTWFDRSGADRGPFRSPGRRFLSMKIAPDGQSVATSEINDGNQDVFIVDEVRGAVQLTVGPEPDTTPVWSGDGHQLAFARRKADEATTLLVRPLDGRGDETPVFGSPTRKSLTSWSRDGYLMFVQRKSGTVNVDWDLWVVPPAGSRTPFPYLDTSAAEAFGQFSPDGRWVAYQSDRSGRNEVYVRSFTAPGSSDAPVVEQPVSTAGGVWPRWHPDGSEVYFIAPDASLMAAKVSTTGSAIAIGAPEHLFRTRVRYGGTPPSGIPAHYDVHPDGRFLINVVASGGEATVPITIIQHWQRD